MTNHDRYSPSRGQGGEYVKRRDHETCRLDGFSRFQSTRYRTRETGRRRLPICSRHSFYTPGYKTTSGVTAGIFPVFSYDKRSSAISAIMIITAFASSLGFITPGWAESTWNARSRPCLRSSRAFFSSSFIQCLPCSEIFGRTLRVATGEAFYQLKIFFIKLCQSPGVTHD